MSERIVTLCLALVCLIASAAGQTPDGITAPAENDDPTRTEVLGSGGTAAETPGQDRPSWRLARGAWEFGFETGFAPTQPVFLSGRKEYDTAGRRFAVGSFRFGRVIGTKGPVTYQWLFEVTPIAVSFNNEVRNPEFVSKKETPRVPRTVRESTYSWAVLPAGVRFIFRPHKRLRPFAQTGAGFIFSRKPIPVPESPTYNFVGDFGGGLMFSVNRRQLITVGYRYYHISNMNIGRINPGYNANVFYFSNTWLTK